MLYKLTWGERTEKYIDMQIRLKKESPEFFMYQVSKFLDYSGTKGMRLYKHQSYNRKDIEHLDG